MSIEMLIMSVMGVIIMSRQFFNTLVGMGSRSHDFDDERGLSEFSEITSAEYFDLAFVIILLHRWHWCF